VASIDRAFDFAAASAANANQHGLFDMGGEDDHGSSTQEPDLVEAMPWGIKERLTFEKTAVGFYLSGHLFDEVTLEVRRFAKRPIEELIDTREPQLLAGIVTDFRVINGQRGKLALFKLDDKSAMIDARAEEELINANKHLFKDDELIIVMGKVRDDRFSGGKQLTITQVWDLEQARCRFGKYLRVAVSAAGTSGAVGGPDVARLVREFPAKREQTEQGELVRGLAVRLAVQRVIDAASVGAAAEESSAAGAGDAQPVCVGAVAELQLGENARFYPSDAALAGWRAQADQGKAVIAYD
jgi:DNA polymerase-3 subunit alpha